LANGPLDDIVQLVKDVTFHDVKAKAIQEVATILVNDYGGHVPQAIDALTALPRVGRKTANVVLSVAYGIAAGIVIDTHGQRVATRMGFSPGKTPEKIELDLMQRLPTANWINFGLALVLHGRYTCTYHRPACDRCTFNDQCPRNGVPGTTPMSKKKKPQQPELFADPEPLPPGDTTAFLPPLPASWLNVLQAEFTKPYWAKLQEFVTRERGEHEIFPPADEVYTAFNLTPFEDVRVLLLGQDPYPGEGQGHGLCFSVKPGVTVPASLRNMYKELQDDLGIPPAKTGYLARWAAQGMLMINAVLTVRAGKPNSHQGQGWETFTDAVIRAVNDKPEPVVFVLWGAYAQKKLKLIDTTKHTVIQAAHPSPLSASNGFFGSKPFSKINAALRANGFPEFDWRVG
jgi:uracil-DNA glycosylase